MDQVLGAPWDSRAQRKWGLPRAKYPQREFRLFRWLATRIGCRRQRCRDRCRGICHRSDELIGSTGVPDSEGLARSGAERKKNVIAGGIALDEGSAGQTADFLLRSRLYRRRTGFEIHLCEAGGARARRAALTAETNENRLRAGSSDARGAGVGEAGNSTDGNGNASSLHRIEHINILRAEIGDNELRTIGRQGQSAQSGAWQRAARRECIGLESTKAFASPDADALRQLVKSQEWGRNAFIYDKADQARDEGAHDASRSGAENNVRLASERDGVCRTLASTTTASTPSASHNMMQ